MAFGKTSLIPTDANSYKEINIDPVEDGSSGSSSDNDFETPKLQPSTSKKIKSAPSHQRVAHGSDSETDSESSGEEIEALVTPRKGGQRQKRRDLARSSGNKKDKKAPHAQKNAQGEVEDDPEDSLFGRNSFCVSCMFMAEACTACNTCCRT